MGSPTGYDSAFDGPAAYQIIVQGTIAPNWSERLEGMAISRASLEDGTQLTTLIGELADQSALTGVLNTIYELHLSLIAVNKLPLADSGREGKRPEG